ncbi:MAG: GAF domain-containing protein [Vulcanimicrobiota bacterium]
MNSLATKPQACAQFHQQLEGEVEAGPLIRKCHAGINCFAFRCGSHTVCGGHLNGQHSEAKLAASLERLRPLLAPCPPQGLGLKLLELLEEGLSPSRFGQRALELVVQALECEAAVLGYREKAAAPLFWTSTTGLEPGDYQEFTRLLDGPETSAELTREQGQGLWLALPGGHGVLVLLWTGQPDLRIYEPIAQALLSELVLACRNSGLAELCDERDEKLRASQRQVELWFGQVGAALASALNLEDLLKLILELSMKLTKAEGGRIQLIEAQNPTLAYTIPGGNGSSSKLYLPITRHDRVKAVLRLDRCEGSDLPIEDLRLLEAFGTQAAMAIENAQIFEWEQQRAREATALYQAARTIEEGQELDEVLEQSAEVLARIAEVDRCLILLKDSHRSFLTVVAATGLSPDQRQFFDEFRLHLSQLSGEFRESLNQGKPLVFDSAPTDNSGVGRLCSLLPTASCLMVPLRAQERLLGLIYLDSSRGAHHFPPSTTRRIMTLSLQVANAIHRASLIQQLQENLGPLKALYQVSTAITGTLSLTKVIRLIVDQAVELLEHSACALLVLDEIGESFRLETSVGLPEELLDPSLQAKVAKTAVERKRAFSHYIEPGSEPGIVPDILQRSGFGGLLSVPLIAKKKMVGVLNCFVKPSIRFRQQEIRLLRGFANQAAIAVENARLHGMIRFKMGELGTLFEVSKAVTSTLRLDRVLDEIVHHVREILRADACSLMLLEGSNLLLKAAEGIQTERHRKPIPVGRGVAGLAAKTGQPMVLFDRDGEDGNRFPATVRSEGLRTILSVPIKTRGRTIGLVNVYYRDITTHTPAQLNLLTAMGSQAAVAIENARLYADKERVTELLRGALIPKERLDFPGLTVGHRFIPSMDLSGDYYDLIPLGPRRCALVIADVSGKGPDAAIQTARAKHVIKSYAMANYEPGKILEMLNRHLSDSDMARQVTVFYAEADLDARTLTFACAGHEPPIFWVPGAQEPVLLRADGIVLGALDGATFEQGTIEVPKDAWILLYTDGLTEARSPSGEFFGLERVFEVLKEHTGNSAQRLVNRLYTRIRKFTRERITDDFSLLAVRF